MMFHDVGYHSKNGPNLGVRHAGLKMFCTQHLPPGNTFEQYSHSNSASINRYALNLNAEFNLTFYKNMRKDYP